MHHALKVMHMHAYRYGHVSVTSSTVCLDRHFSAEAKTKKGLICYLNTCLSGRIAKLPTHNKGVLIVPRTPTAHTGP